MMHSRRNFLIFAGAVVGVLALAALARGALSGRAGFDNKNVILEGEYQLATVHEGDLVVAGDSINLTESSRVTGDASLIGNSLNVAGTVGGDLTAGGKDFTLAPSARIDGDVNVSGGSVSIGGKVGGDLSVSAASVTILPDAEIGGSLSACGQQISDQRANAGTPECTSPALQPMSSGARTIGLIVLAVVGTLSLTGMSVISVTFFPRQISRIEEAMRARPRSFGGVGLATYALALGLFAALAFLLAVFPPLGLLLIPLFLILCLLVFLLSATGLITMTVMIGDWLLRRRRGMFMPPLVAGVVGSLVLSAGVFVISLLPFGFPISLFLLGAISSVGLGASLFTRVGTRPVGRTYFIQG